MTTETKTRAEKIAAAIADVEASRAEFIAALNPDDQSMVIAYENGLCVGIGSNGKCGIVGPIAAPLAEVIERIGTARNGHGEIAKRRRRQDVIAQRVAECEQSIQMFRDMEAGQ
jgi:hypothetical protein